MTPFDDLESIFYILVWIIFGHKQPLLKDHRIAMGSMVEPFSEWFGGNEEHNLADYRVAKLKTNFLTNYSEIQTVHPTWLPLLPLLNKYHKLLHGRQVVLLQRKKGGLGVKLEALDKDTIDAFDEVLGYFTQTLEVEMANNSSQLHFDV
jgi:hypothetical protein